MVAAVLMSSSEVWHFSICDSIRATCLDCLLNQAFQDKLSGFSTLWSSCTCSLLSSDRDCFKLSRPAKDAVAALFTKLEPRTRKHSGNYEPAHEAHTLGHYSTPTHTLTRTATSTRSADRRAPLPCKTHEFFLKAQSLLSRAVELYMAKHCP